MRNKPLRSCRNPVEEHARLPIDCVAGAYATAVGLARS